MAMGIAFLFDKFTEFQSRRSPVLALNGMVASSQPLASQAGLAILKQGGNAADAAVATAAALNVTEPMSTGIGGDCFALFFDAHSKLVKGVNGSGRAPAGLTIDVVREAGIKLGSIPSHSPHAVTVPGAVSGWIDTIERFGRLTLPEVLAPAIQLAEDGYPVGPLTAFAWATTAGKLKKKYHGADLLPGGRAPDPGQVVRNPLLAAVFREVAEHGKVGFYEGRVADAIVSVLHTAGGVLTIDDLAQHASTFEDPISTNYRGVEVYEMPPNGQGITALLALNLLEEFNVSALAPLSPEYNHLLIECLRLAFADARRYVADPTTTPVPVDELLSKAYAAERRQLIDLNRATLDQPAGRITAGSDTVYLSVVDGEGNACSFINSNYEAFGTGIVPDGCGFVLQNRGSNFSLDPDHPNALAPRKRPYHTIIPAMATQGGDLYACFGVMGGFMQPQGHVQVLSKMVDLEYDPQAALDAPRFCLLNGHPSGNVAVEDGIPRATVDALANMGHEIQVTSGVARAIFGQGQIIRRDPESGVLWGGADPRGDGCALGF